MLCAEMSPERQMQKKQKKSANSVLGAEFSKGSNQRGVKQYNEKLVIDVVRRLDAVSKAEITRITGLSAQTITVIANRLIDEQLLLKDNVVRGKVGQPSVPLRLNPDGAISLGIKLGRRTSQVIAISFTYDVLEIESLHYDYPDSSSILDWLKHAVTTVIGKLTSVQRARVVGIGLAMPAHLHSWEGIIDAPEGVLSEWQHIDVMSWLASEFGLPVHKINDASAACLAEMSLHHRTHQLNCIYYYVGTFFGGGIALGGHIFEGNSGQAASVASLPLSLPKDGKSPSQMVSAAGLHTLEAEAIARGFDRNIFLSEQPLQDVHLALFDGWAEEAACALAFAVIGGQCYLDAPVSIIDGRLPEMLMSRLVEKVETAFEKFDLRGIALPQLQQGRLGMNARPLGAAIVPLHHYFSLSTLQLQIKTENN